MNHRRTSLWTRAAVTVVGGLATAAALAAGPAGSGRTAKQIGADLTATTAEIAEKCRFPDAIKYDPKYKQQMGRECGPLYAKQAELFRELSAAGKAAAATYNHLALVDDARVAFWGGDGADAAKSRIDDATAAKDAVTATDGKAAGDLIDWWSAFGDADGQGKAVAAVAALAKAQPTSAAVADDAHLMLITCPASVAVGQRLNDLLVKDLAKTSLGKSYAATPNKLFEPLAVDGTTVLGKSFKSGQYKGKVVLVDFWATWCPPCREEIPHVAKMYAQYHAQGLEIVGVSSDNAKPDLTGFLREHPEMPWTELFQAGNGWHPLTKKFGIYSIPTMYLIDRNGLLRTMDARSSMDEMIPLLLAEGGDAK